MQAAEAKLQRVLEGSKQFLVPHYQRPYSWQPEQWEALWRDILVLLEEENSQPHFLGSIVTSPAKSVPEGVEKRLLIDGQQRLTTLLILLALVRDQARGTGLDKLASQIEDLYLTNRYESGNDYYKLLPTQGEDPSLSDRAEIEKRAESLAERALGVWPYYGPIQLPSSGTDKSPVTGTVPHMVNVRGHNYPVKAWVEVALVTVEAIAGLGDEEFNRVAAELPCKVR